MAACRPALAAVSLILLASTLLPGRLAHAVDCDWSFDPAIGQPGLWTSGGGSAAYGMAILDGDLVAGGIFDMAGGQPALNVARWDGAQWSAMGNGFSSTVWSLKMFRGSLYAFGQFQFAWPARAWRAARWNGASWQPLGSDHGLQRPPDPEHGAASVSIVRGDSLIVGGAFTRAGDRSVGLIAAWDGSEWHPLGAGFDSLVSDSGTCTWARYPAVLALAEYEGDLIAGGSFRLTAGGDVVHCLARWDGSAWHPLGGGVGTIPSDCSAPWVYALTVWNGDLIVGGTFRTAGGQQIARVARWDGASWHAMGTEWTTNAGGAVWELAVTQSGELVAGGWLQVIGKDFNKWQMARWNGTDWDQLGPDLTWISSPAVTTLFPWGEDLVVAGGFTGNTDGDTMNYVSILRCNSTTGVEDATVSVAPGLRTTGSNPFSSSTTFAFVLPIAAADLALDVHDLAGRQVRTLRAGAAGAGEHSVRWDGRRDDGEPVPPGVYFARLRVGDEVRSLRVVRL